MNVQPAPPAVAVPVVVAVAATTNNQPSEQWEIGSWHFWKSYAWILKPRHGSGTSSVVGQQWRPYIYNTMDQMKVKGEKKKQGRNWRMSIISTRALLRLKNLLISMIPFRFSRNTESRYTRAKSHTLNSSKKLLFIEVSAPRCQAQSFTWRH